MSTNTSNMGDKSPEEIRLELTRERRLAGLQKARDAKKEKRLAEDGTSTKTKSTKSEVTRDHWMDVFLTLMKNYQAKGLKDVANVIDMTDDVMDLLKDAGKI